MKKTLYLIILAAACVWFFFARNSFAERDVSDIYNHYKSPSNEGAVVEFYDNPKSIDLKDLVDVLYEISDKYSVSVFYDSIDREQSVYHEYLISPYSIKELYGLDDAPDIVYKEKDKVVHISNDPQEPLHFRTVNRKQVIIIDSFNQINKDDFTEDQFFYVGIRGENPRTERLVAEEIIERFDQYSPNLFEGTQDAFDYDSQIKKDLKTVMFFMVILLCMFLLFYLASERKNIAIYKLNGFSGLSIFRELLGKDVLLMISAVAAESALLFIICIGFVNSRSLELLKYYLTGIGLMVFVLLVLGLIFSLISRLFSLNSLIKGQSITQLLSFGTYVLKFAVLIVMVPVVLNSVMEFVPVYNLYRYTENNREKLNRTVFFSGRTNEYGDWEPVYFEMSDNTSNEHYLKEIEITDAFIREGAHMFSDFLLEIGDPVHGKSSVVVADVNENYILDEFPDGREKSQITSLLAEGKEILVLSSKYSEDQYSVKAALGRGNIPVIVLSSNVETVNYSGQFEYQPVEIWHVFPNDAPMLDKVIFKRYYLPDMTDAQIHRILSEYSAENMYMYQSVGETVEWYRNLRKSDAINSAIRIALYGALLLLTMEGFYVSYKSANAEKIAVKRLHGYSYFSVYSDYYIECILLYIPLLIVADNKVLLLLIIAVFQTVQYVRNRIAEFKTTIPVLLKSGGEL
ncbi:MAG: hypothetical protein IIY75_08410 [Erysipelotrichales bacterium]|nr:hypothetical protein [Erysipelotrichales bacterium]